MSDVKRYDWDRYDGMYLDERGDWVDFDDYAALAARLAEAERDAALGRIAMRFVDRAGDTCPEDPAERICEQFYWAMSDEVDRQLNLRRIEEAGRE